MESTQKHYHHSIANKPAVVNFEKKTIATVSLAGCFGCHMSLLDIDTDILDVVELVSFNKSPLTDIKNFTQRCHLGLVEGGCCNDENIETLKKFREMCDILVPCARWVLIVPLHSERSADPEVVLHYCHERWPHIPVEAEASAARAVDRALSDPNVVIAGSLHLIGEVMEHLHLVPSGNSERELNEWDAARRK